MTTTSLYVYCIPMPTTYTNDLYITYASTYSSVPSGPVFSLPPFGIVPTFWNPFFSHTFRLKLSEVST